MIRFMFFQHKVDHSRQLVGSRRDRHGGAMSAADAPKKCAQGAVTVLQTSGGNAQSGRSPVLGRLHPSLFHFAASDAIIWAQVQPRGKVLDRGPRAHIGSNFAEDLLDGQCVHPIDRGQIHSGHAVEGGGQVKMGLVLAPGSATRRRWGRAGVLRRVKLAIKSLQRPITGLDLRGVVVKQLHGLFQHKDLCGSRSPARMVRRMAIPVTPVMSLSTLLSRRFISIKAFCMCCTWAERYCTNISRWRTRLRMATICSGGRNEACNNP